MQARRNVVKDLTVSSTTHAGLWWDKYLLEQNDQNDNGDEGVGAKATHIREIAGIAVPQGYREAFDRWQAALKETPHTYFATAKVDGRMVIGIGEKGALEVGLRLHHTWGVPYIPGSALKGVAAAAAHKLLKDERWRRDRDAGDLHRFLFGTTDAAGAIEFHDALWDGKGAKLPIHQDVMTVHHAKYYQHGGQGEQPAPSDMDSPNPVAFASVNGSYQVAISARPGVWGEGELSELEDWVDVALEVLALGLADLGIGAKTNAGYGRIGLGHLPAKVQREQSLPPEVRWVTQNASLIADTASAQCKWLLASAMAGHSDLGDRVWRDLLLSHLSTGVVALRSLSEGGEPPELVQAREKLQVHQGKKPKGALRGWLNKKRKMETTIVQRERQALNADKDREKARALVEWLEGTTAEEG